MSDLRPIVDRLRKEGRVEIAGRVCELRNPSPPRARARIAKDAKGMNKTEAAYAKVLEAMREAGEVWRWRFEAIKLRLADRTTYTPDFLVTLPSGEMEFHEVKGFWRDDARVKVKVAAEMYPEFHFLSVQKCAGGWKTERF